MFSVKLRQAAAAGSSEEVGGAAVGADEHGIGSDGNFLTCGRRRGWQRGSDDPQV
jgi:hypothetical protein